MKNFPKIFKYIIFSLVLIVASFIFSEPAHANVYDYPCPDGGFLHATVTLSPLPPYNPSSPAAYTAQVYMTNNCATRNAYFTAQQSGGGTVYTIVPSQTIPANGITITYSQNFTTPTNGGLYSLDFVTYSDDPTSNCGTALSGNWGTTGYHQYPDFIYDFGASTGAVTGPYEVYEVPDKFTVRRVSDNAIVFQTSSSGLGYIGYADYSGPWGSYPPTFNTGAPYRGTISFNVTERYYRFQVETSVGPTVSDAWDAGLGCVSGPPPPVISGTLSPTSAACTITNGNSSCTQNLSWTTSNPVGTSTVTNSGGATPSPSSGNTGTNVAFTVPYNPTGVIFSLFNNSYLLSQSTITASCAGGTSWDSLQSKCTSTPISGTITPTASTCTIASGASSCTQTISWTTTNPVATSAVTNNGTATPAPSNGNNGTNVSFTIPYQAATAGTTTFYLYNNSYLLANTTVTTQCTSGTSWNGTTCAAASSISNVTWINVVNSTASGNNLTKTSADGWGSGGAFSSQSIASGDGYVEFTVNEANTYKMVGFNDVDTDQNYSNMDHFFGLTYSGTFSLYENGAGIAPNGTYAAGDVFRISIESGLVKYYKNGALIYTSAKAPVYPVHLDVSGYSQNATVMNAKVATGTTAPTNTAHVQPAYGQTLMVSGISGFTQPTPISSGTYDAPHGGFTGVIQVQLTFPSGPPGAGIRLIKNGSSISCISTPPPQSSANFGFPSATYLGSDDLAVTSTLSCP